MEIGDIMEQNGGYLSNAMEERLIETKRLKPRGVRNSRRRSTIQNIFLLEKASYKKYFKRRNGGLNRRMSVFMLLKFRAKKDEY